MPTSSVTLSLSPSVKWSGSFTGTLSSGFFGPFGSYLSASFSGRTKSPPLIVSFEPSGYLIVALPLSSTVTSVPFGRSGFTLPTSSVTLSLSPLVKWSGSFTGTLSSGFFGPFGSYLSLWFGSTVTLTVVVVVEPSGKVVLTTPVRLPVESVSGLVIHSCLVPSGKLVGLPSGVWATTVDFGSTWLPLGTVTSSLGATL